MKYIIISIKADCYKDSIFDVECFTKNDYVYEGPVSKWSLTKKTFEKSNEELKSVSFSEIAKKIQWRLKERDIFNNKQSVLKCLKENRGYNNALDLTEGRAYEIAVEIDADEQNILAVSLYDTLAMLQKKEPHTVQFKKPVKIPPSENCSNEQEKKETMRP